MAFLESIESDKKKKNRKGNDVVELVEQVKKQILTLSQMQLVSSNIMIFSFVRFRVIHKFINVYVMEAPCYRWYGNPSPL